MPKSKKSNDPKWKENVVIIPRFGISLSSRVEFTPLHLVNNNPFRLAFKLKTTRNRSLRPNITCGFLDPNGGCVHIRIGFKPLKREKRLHDNDRLTIVMNLAEKEETNLEACFLDKKEAPCARFVLKLRQALSTDAIGTVDDMQDFSSTSE